MVVACALSMFSSLHAKKKDDNWVPRNRQEVFGNVKYDMITVAA